MSLFCRVHCTCLFSFTSLFHHHWPYESLQHRSRLNAPHQSIIPSAITSPIDLIYHLPCPPSNTNLNVPPPQTYLPSTRPSSTLHPLLQSEFESYTKHSIPCPDTVLTCPGWMSGRPISGTWPVSPHLPTTTRPTRLSYSDTLSHGSSAK